MLALRDYKADHAGHDNPGCRGYRKVNHTTFADHNACADHKAEYEGNHNASYSAGHTTVVFKYRFKPVK